MPLRYDDAFDPININHLPNEILYYYKDYFQVMCVHRHRASQNIVITFSDKETKADVDVWTPDKKQGWKLIASKELSP